MSAWDNYDSWKRATPAETYRCAYVLYSGVCGESTEQSGGRLNGDDYCLPHLTQMLDTELPAEVQGRHISVDHETMQALEEAIFWADSTGRKYQLFVRMQTDEDPSLPVCRYGYASLHGKPSRVHIDGDEEWLCIDCINTATRAGKVVA